ncbi:molybdopterin-dependent oxidoreductase [Amycolatopsis deserti]|uniref:molybdopterin-dependent oxidoreductase n=1 Tax=Amycolatopsis deserti TaxID=185696 RepID=UPI001E5D5BEF|nr:molybdopterin-dependent oxidoreductase [Amycolatopsis deserti]
MTTTKEPRPRGWTGRLARIGSGALLGLLATAAALGVGELVAAFTGAATAPGTAVGTALINLAPHELKDFAVQRFGTNDKVVLVGGVLLALVLLGMAAGVLALRRLWAGIAVVVALGVAGMVAAATAPVAGPTSVLPSLAALLAGVATLVVLVRLRNGRTEPSTTDSPHQTTGRRTVLLAGGAVAGFAVLSGGAGRLLQGGGSLARSRARVRIPAPASPAPALPAGYQFRDPGLVPFFTPNAGFYRVDTALVLPRVPAEQWSLRIHGMAAREIELSFDDLLARPLVERDLTLSCVSNEVGGPYVSTARFVGVPLASLLREAGIRPGAEQLVSTGADGMTIGSPTELILDGRNALLAVAMNGEPLPVEHGFPARLIVPGLFGYASATKWVTDLNLTTYATQPYWIQRGYDRTGPAKTGSRIDVPKPLSRVRAGEVVVAGVAYAQHRGISAVQLSFDGGPWQDADLTTQVTPDTWRQWRYRWSAAPGTHRIQVRAADGAGRLQPETRAPVFPSGADGWESIVVTVTT